MRQRVLGVVVLLLLAPVTAELLQAYLGDLGGIGGVLFLVVFFAPFYGAAALLVREVSVRTGRGWTGRLLLAAAFGVLMATVVDGSLFTPVRDDVDGWSAIVGAARVGDLGLYAALTWVGGHVVMSVAAPTVVAESLARHPGPWLPRWALAVPATTLVCFAAFVHHDQVTSYRVDAGPVQYSVAVLVALALVAAAFSPWGRPLPSRDGRPPTPWVLLLLGALAMAGFDLMPQSWAGVVQGLAVAAVTAMIVARWGRRTGWTVRHTAALALGALLTRTLTGFLSPPPPSTTWSEKLTQNVTYLLLVLALAWSVERRTRAGALRTPAPGRAP
ncbi:MAG: hypothetical protein PGN07_02190 [Aeromicrobium erythreum]